MPLTFREAVRDYTTTNGGPKIREHFENLENLSLNENPGDVKRKVDRVIKDIAIESRVNRVVKNTATESKDESTGSFDPRSLVDLAYQNFRTAGASTPTSLFELGIFILQGTNQYFGVPFDEQQILERGYNSITNNGDRELQVIEREFGYTLDLERVMDEAYRKTGESGFTSRALDALCYAHEHGAEIDTERLDMEVIEQDMIRGMTIGSERGKKEHIQKAERHLKVLGKYGINL